MTQMVSHLPTVAALFELFCLFLLNIPISLVPFPILENKTGPYTIEYLTKRLLTIGATPSGGFLVDCESFQCVSDTFNQQMGKCFIIFFCHFEKIA